MSETQTPRVLVTGAGGFIGRELCRQLEVEQCHIVTITRRAAPGRASTQPAHEMYGLTGDIRDRDLLRRAVEGVETVYHLAGIAHVDTRDQGLLRAVNVQATVALAESAAAAGVRRLVFFSSSLALAAETDPSHSTGYGHSKLAAERALKEVTARSPLKVCILRPVNVYGSGMKGNLATLIRLVRRGLLPPLPRLDTRTSLVGVEDLCRAARLVATHADAAGRTFLVSDGMEYRLLEIEAAIYQALGRTPPRLRPPRLLWWGAAAGAELVSRFRPGQVTPGLRTYRNLVTDSVYAADRLDETFGYQPSETFYTALPGLVGIK